MKVNKHLHNSIMEVVDNQIRSNDPPETKQTFERLVKSGISKIDAKKYIGQCVGVELFHVMKYHETFNEVRFIKNLKNLPAEPYDDEE